MVWGYGKVGLWEDGVMGRWGYGKMGLWEDGVTGRWGYGKVEIHTQRGGVTHPKQVGVATV